MTAIVMLVCNGDAGCGATTITEAEADVQGVQYGRSLAARKGWTSKAPGRTKRDWEDRCPACSPEEELEEILSPAKCASCGAKEERSPLFDLFGHTAQGHRVCHMVMQAYPIERRKADWRAPIPMSWLLELEDGNPDWISRQGKAGPAAAAVYNLAVRRAHKFAAEQPPEN